MKRARLLPLATIVCALINSSCSSDDSGGSGTGPTGGPVTGAADAHCDGREPVKVDPATCEGSGAEGGAPGDEDGASQAGASDCNATHDGEYGDTLPNSAGDDDDCKYHASFTSTPIRLNEDATFTVTATDLATGKPLEPLSKGGEPALSRVEVYQPCKPTRRAPAEDYSADLKETGPGVYSAGPLRFDQSGRWVVRFHFYESCVDGDTSPHGHIAFFVDVP